MSCVVTVSGISSGFAGNDNLRRLPEYGHFRLLLGWTASVGCVLEVLTAIVDRPIVDGSPNVGHLHLFLLLNYLRLDSVGVFQRIRLDGSYALKLRSSYLLILVSYDGLRRRSLLETVRRIRIVIIPLRVAF